MYRGRRSTVDRTGGTPFVDICRYRVLLSYFVASKIAKDNKNIIGLEKKKKRASVCKL